MKIGIDMMGGDNPKQIIGAIEKFVQKYNIEVYGFIHDKCQELKPLEKSDKVTIIYCNDIITKDDDPTLVVRTRKESSLIIGAKYLKEGIIDAFISAENTAAIVTTGIFVLKRKDKIAKPALPGLFPIANKNTPLMILDLGANIYPTVDNMMQYAGLADSYLKKYYQVNNPRIKLLNIGEEANKGRDLQKEVYKLLMESEFNFCGNIEARDVFDGSCDIILTDGFSGNILLKSLEGAAKLFSKNLKSVFYKNTFNKLSGLIVKKDLVKMYNEFDYRKFGATPVLGVNGLLLKAHGSSDEKAFLNALIQAKVLIENK